MFVLGLVKTKTLLTDCMPTSKTGEFVVGLLHMICELGTASLTALKSRFLSMTSVCLFFLKTQSEVHGLKMNAGQH